MNILIILLVLFFLILLWMLVRTLRLKKMPPEVSAVEKPQIDKERLSTHLSEAIQIKTVSKMEMSDKDREPFLEMHTWIEKTYPFISKSLERTIINNYSLLYKWGGTDSRLKPVLLNAHMDVVPVDEKTRSDWRVDPFGGERRDGYIWGRGALDMKGILVALLESTEMLLKDGYQPKRSIYLTFGHDEEISGFQGSLKIMEYLKSKGVKLAAVLDEGGMLTSGLVTDPNNAVAMIGIAEKGYLSMKLTAEGKPGHSSRPPRQTAIGIISRAVALMDDHPMPACLTHILPTLEKISYLLPFSKQFAIANAGILKPLLIKELEKQTETNALIRTTHAATMINGGMKDNVLPASASAVINLRLMPGDSIDGVFSYFAKVINDPRVKLEMASQISGWEASKVSATDDPAYLTLELVVRQIFDNVPVAPFLFMAATDSRHYQPICENIYKFSPYRITPEEHAGVHGVNERISQEALSEMTTFYSRLMQVWGNAEF